MFALKFKAQLPLEEDFLRQLGNPLLLRPEDESWRKWMESGMEMKPFDDATSTRILLIQGLLA